MTATLATPARDSLAESGDQVRTFLGVFAEGAPDRLVVELRALASPQPYGRPATEYGFFDLATQEGQAAFGEALETILARPPARQPEGVYVTMNPLDPALLARADHRLKVAKDRGLTAADKDVVARRWVLVDVDPTRPAGIGSTDAEKEIARHVIDLVREDLDRRGWPRPVLCDSGNGYHLWYPVDLPAADGGKVERLLKALAREHDFEDASIDTSVFNAARIAKLPGTWARKGDSTADRPHRMARVLEFPPL